MQYENITGLGLYHIRPPASCDTNQTIDIFLYCTNKQVITKSVSRFSYVIHD